MPTNLALLVDRAIANPWYRQYSRELHRLYDVDRETTRRAHAGISIGLLCLFYMSCFAWDLLLLPDVWKISLLCKLVVTPIVGGTAFAYSRSGPGHLVETRNAIAIIIATCLWSVELMATKDHIGVLTYLSLAPVLIIVANIFCNLPLRSAALTSLVIFTILSCVIFASIKNEYYFLIGSISTMGWISILTLFINWRSNREQIRVFLHQLKSDLQQRTIETSNIELLRLSSTDALTSLRNRRSTDAALTELWRDWTVDRRPFALMLVDVDFFKRYNDGYGHVSGDECLMKIAAAMEDVMMRHNGIIGRFGGEEFLVLMRSERVDAIPGIAASLQGAVRALKLAHRHRPDSIDIVTISGGIAFSSDASDGAKPETLVKLADEALYHAKQNGRNRICARGGAFDRHRRMNGDDATSADTDLDRATKALWDMAGSAISRQETGLRA